MPRRTQFKQSSQSFIHNPSVVLSLEVGLIATVVGGCSTASFPVVSGFTKASSPATFGGCERAGGGNVDMDEDAPEKGGSDSKSYFYTCRMTAIIRAAQKSR